jgi:hypothetical protein
VRPAEESLVELYRREGFNIGVMNYISEGFDIKEGSQNCCIATQLSDKESIIKLSEEIKKQIESLKPVFVWEREIIEFCLYDSATNPKTKTQLNFILTTGNRKDLERQSCNLPKKDFAFIKLLNKELSHTTFQKSLFLFTLE